MALSIINLHRPRRIPPHPPTITPITTMAADPGELPDYRPLRTPTDNSVGFEA